MQRDRSEIAAGQKGVALGHIPAGLAAALALGLILAGCSGTETEGAPPPGPVAEDENQPPADMYGPAGLPGSSYGGMANLPPVDDNPKQLIGLDRDALKDKLGEPGLVRRDGDAEIWQYRAEQCVLDLFLYGAEKKVEHVDLRDREKGDELSVRECFADMLRERLITS